MRKMLLVVAIGAIAGMLLAVVMGKSDLSKNGGRALARTGELARDKGAARQPRTATIPQLSAARIEAPPSIVNDPTLKTYDAVKLSNATGVPLLVVFAKEPRHPIFGPDMEKRLQYYFTRDLESTGVKTRLLRAECRTRICVTTFEADNPEQMRQLTLLLGYVPIANVYQPGAEVGPNTREFIFAWDGEEKDAATWILGYPQVRRARLAEMRQKVNELGAHPAGYPGIPADVEPLR